MITENENKITEDSAIKKNEEEIAMDTAATGNEEACTEQVKTIGL